MKRSFLALATMAVAILVGAPAAVAATIPVTTTTDELNSDGDCSLREAIQAANTDTPVDACPPGTGPDTITLPPGAYTLAIPGMGEDANTTGDLDVTSDLVIAGGGAGGTIIDGADLDRVLHAHGAINFVLSGLTVRGGGGGVCEGAGIYAYSGGTLSVTNSVVRENRGGDGGGIFSQGTATLDRTTVSGNIGMKRGGGITNAGTMIINNSTIDQNHAPAFFGGFLDPPCSGLSFFGAGGIFSDANLTLTNSTISGNTTGTSGVGTSGGGLYSYGSASVATISNTTISGNFSNDRGGGIFNVFGRLDLTNSTISGNRAIQNGGGAFTLGEVTLESSTISDNTSQNGTGGLQTDFGGNYSLRNTILANSSPADCSGAMITSLGYNLIEDPSGCVIVGDTTGNVTGLDPMLGALANNGGPTMTHALLPGSPAIDAGHPVCPPPATDQRGVLRPQGTRCDIGSFELEVTVVPRVPQHFQSYDVSHPETVTETVTLVDQFGTRTVRLEEIDWLMNPVEKRRTGREPVPIERPEEHLTCYEISYMSSPARTVHVRNQFVGDSTLRIGRPLALCTPASKTLAGTPGDPPTDLDHFECYDVTSESPIFRSETLELRDQFGTRTVRIDRARELCNPVEKRRAGRAPEPVIRPDEHYVCYRIVSHTPAFTALTVFTRDQFDLETLRVTSPRRLCVPSEKFEGPPPS